MKLKWASNYNAGQTHRTTTAK